MANYFLMNGKDGKGNALNLVDNGKLKRAFVDLSEIDCQTLEIPYQKAKEIISEYNPGTDLNGDFYDVQYPFKKTLVKSFASMFSYNDANAKVIEDTFHSFAEERLYNKLHGKKLKLRESQALEDYYRSILDYILSQNQGKILTYDSLISAALKELLKKRYTEYGNKSTWQFLNAKSYVLKSFLSNYTELRNLTIEYLAMREKDIKNLRKLVKEKERFQNNGMSAIKETPWKPKDSDNNTEYEQLSFFDDYNLVNKGYQRIRKK